MFLALGSIAWLGSITMRWILSSRLLIGGTLEFQPDLNPIVEREVFRLMNYSSTITLIGYFAVFSSGIVFLSTTDLRMKENGWLMMSALLFYLFTPVEMYTSYLDGRMISGELWGTPELSLFRELLIKRLGALKGLPFIALLCYCTIIALVIWQPMKKRLAPQSS
ncbi:MAG: hypothetical protein AABZ61_06655 [Bacteroidota bacterium]